MRHWTDGLSAAAIRAELNARVHEDAAHRLEELRADLDTIAPMDRPGWSWEWEEFREWFPGSLKRADEYIEGEP
jgi:hypothetical protein